MNQVIILHGMPSKEEYLGDMWPSPSNAHWIPWIQKQLSRKEILSQAIELPRPYEPDYESWKAVFEQFSISNETIIVGHSCGAGFLLRYISENKGFSPKKLILVAPWIDPEPGELTNGFFEFEIDESISGRTNLVVLYSTDDDPVCVKSAKIIEEKLPKATYHKFSNKGHFTEPDLGSKEFPELLEEILK